MNLESLLNNMEIGEFESPSYFKSQRGVVIRVTGKTDEGIIRNELMSDDSYFTSKSTGRNFGGWLVEVIEPQGGNINDKDQFYEFNLNELEKALKVKRYDDHRRFLEKSMENITAIQNSLDSKDPYYKYKMSDLNSKHSIFNRCLAHLEGEF